MKTIVLLILLGLAFLYILESWYERNGWSLMTCDGLMPNGFECSQHLSVSSGFRTFQECYETGTTLAADTGFECGRKCRTQGVLQVCEEICNASGCH